MSSQCQIEEESQIISPEQCEISFPKSKIILQDIQSSIANAFDIKRPTLDENQNSNHASTQASKNCDNNNEVQNIQNNYLKKEQFNNQHPIVESQKCDPQQKQQNVNNNINTNNNQTQNNNQSLQAQNSQNNSNLLLVQVDKYGGDQTKPPIKKVKINADVEINLFFSNQNKKADIVGGVYYQKNLNIITDSVNSGSNNISDSNTISRSKQSQISNQKHKKKEKNNKKNCCSTCIIF